MRPDSTVPVAHARPGWVLPLAAAGRGAADQVGGKCAGLGELISLGIPVPEGFAVTVHAFRYFLEHNRLREPIASLLREAGAADPARLQAVSARIRDLVEAQPLGDLDAAIRAAYRQLGGGGSALVAVRSSAVAEDQVDASFAGQLETYLFVRGEEAVLAAVRRCFGSAFTARSLAYRRERGLDLLGADMSVAVQRMVVPRSAGVLFTLDPRTGDRTVVAVEACFGAGESLAQGRVTPDLYLVDKSGPDGSPAVRHRRIETKAVMTVPDPAGGAREVPVPPELRRRACLTDGELLELARWGMRIEQHYGAPVDVEWALEEETGRLYILQARPETVWSRRGPAPPDPRANGGGHPEVGPAARVILRGLGASPGVATGRVRVIRDVAEIPRFRPGEILVTEMTTTEWLPAMRAAAALVTDAGGVTCHAAIVSRELGIPCVVGTGSATRTLVTGQEVTVDAVLGTVYEGRVDGARRGAPGATGTPAGPAPGAGAPGATAITPVTATRLFMILGNLERLPEVRSLPFDGIGMMRIEFLIAERIGVHPLHLIDQGRAGEFVDRLAGGIAELAGAVAPRPVIVRFSDLKTNEYRVLRGGADHEPVEANPMIGWRGAARYVSAEYEAAFRLEVRAVRRVREAGGLRNVHVMIPFARRTREVEAIHRILAEEGLRRGPDFQVWIMTEVPSNFILADRFARLCDGFAIGTNDIVQTNLGVDRDSELLARMGYFDELSPAVLAPIGHLIDAAHRNRIPAMVCGQAPSVYPEFCEYVVRRGADILGLQPDAVARTREIVAAVEQQMLIEGLAGRRSP